MESRPGVAGPGNGHGRYWHECGGRRGAGLQHPVNVRAVFCGGGAGCRRKDAGASSASVGAGGGRNATFRRSCRREAAGVPAGRKFLTLAALQQFVLGSRRAQFGLAGNTMRCRARNHLRKQQILASAARCCGPAAVQSAGLRLAWGSHVRPVPLPNISVSLSGLAPQSLLNQKTWWRS